MMSGLRNGLELGKQGVYDVEAECTTRNGLHGDARFCLVGIGRGIDGFGI